MSFEPGQASLTRGEIAAEISTMFVQLLKEHADRGPTKCRTYVDDDLVIVLMRGGFSRLENTLFEDGKFLDVRAMRHALQDTMEGALHGGDRALDRPSGCGVHERDPPAPRSPDGGLRAQRRTRPKLGKSRRLSTVGPTPALGTDQPSPMRAPTTHRSSAKPVAAKSWTSAVTAATTSEGARPPNVWMLLASRCWPNCSPLCRASVTPSV